MGRFAVCALVLTGLVGCGPSIRMVHQSNAYFERCHAADYDPDVAAATKRSCWSAWLQHYREGQPPDRVQYARERVRDLDSGEGNEPLPGLTNSPVSYTASYLTSDDGADVATEPETTEAVGEPAQGSTEAPVEAVESVVEPPQPQPGLEVRPPDVVEVEPVERPDRGLGACAPVCAPRFDACIARCDNRPRSCERACEAEQRICMRGCY